jgi:hypothetical protein
MILGLPCRAAWQQGTSHVTQSVGHWVAADAQVTAQKAAIMHGTEAIAQLVEPQAIVDLGAVCTAKPCCRCID